MLSLDDARGQLLERAVLARGETVSITDAVGRVLVDPRVVAAVDVPAFANSAMDGFALRAADAPGPLRLTGQVAAGASSLPSVEPGSTVRIMTGAPMPPGADTVVPIEEAVEAADGVTVPTVVPSGAHVRPAAHDTRAGDEVCLPGLLTPAAIAVLASLGIGSVEVRRRPMVAVLSTGDELAGPGDDLRPGQIHDANTPALAAAVIEAGGQPLVLPRAPDEREAIEHALADAAARADLVVTSGGVSVGRHDHVREVLEERGELGFWRIAVQPGKPLAVGGLDGTTVIGLPGNPVSALVTFELFVRPFIRAALGLSGDGRLHLRARPDARIEKDAARRAFLRVVVSGDGDELRARAAGGQMSSQLRPMADANALLVVPEGPDAAEPERTYEAIMLGPIRDVA
jgi:molybdopterin molybdotransferase